MSKQRRNQGDEPRVEQQDDGIIERLVGIRRTSKVVKGGSRFSFSALVVVGDGNGRAGYGLGKAKEVPESIRKATERARKSMVDVPIRERRTLFHEVKGKHGPGAVVLRPAAAGTGIIAGGSMRPIFEALGVSDVLAKSTGTTNPHNLIKATFAALRTIQSPDFVAAKRGKTLDTIR